MTVLQSGETQNTEGFWLRGDYDVKDDLTILTDGGRAIPLAKYTLMAQIVATLKLVPMTSLVLTTGASVPFGIFLGEDIPAADLVAGDVTDQQIAVLGEPADFDIDKLVFDQGTLDIDDIIDTGTIQATTIRSKLSQLGFNASEAQEIFQTQPLT